MIRRLRRVFTDPERASILEMGIGVARRRADLGFTQTQLDRAAGFTVRTVNDIERATISHRSMPPSDPRVLKVLATLDNLESDPTWSAKARGPAHRSRTSPRALRAHSPKTSRAESQTLTATLKKCPEHDLWITQAGCDAILKTHSICKARRFGLGCNGIAHRHFHKGGRIEKKEISVEYTPPKPAPDSNRMRFEDWT